jgi:hypothetical protein
MREAGFTDEEIARWEKTSTHPSRTLLGGSTEAEGDVRDVKWKKRGEEREWDVGKDELPSESDEDRDRAQDKKTHDHDRAKAKAKARGGSDDTWRRPQNGLLKQFQSALR